VLKRLLRLDLLVVSGLLAIGLIAVLLLPAGQVFSGPTTDLAYQFAAWRAFAAASIRAGHLPLWNPYTYSGEPFLGGFQSALFYPFNGIFLVMPLERALNFSMLLHLVILGWGMYRWAIQRGFHPIAAALCGLALPLSGPVFPHVYAGHLSNLCTMAWAPWILAGLERGWGEGRRGGFFQASAAICLQIFAGHVQYVFFTGVAASIDALAWSLTDRSVRRRALPFLAICYGSAAALAAVQLLPGFAAAAESVRQGGLPFARASRYFFPGENLLSLFLPNFLEYPVDRHLDFSIYWGRWDSSEMSAFIGASGLLLAGVGLAAGRRRRAVGRDLAVAVLLGILALGTETPLYGILYEHAPGFSQFRGMSKFTFPAMLFLGLAVGAGIDAVVRRAPITRWVTAIALIAGLGVAEVGVALWLHPGPMVELAYFARSTGTNYSPPESYQDPSLMRSVGTHTGTLLVWAGGILLLSGGSLALARRRPDLRWLVLAVFPLEMIAYAYGNFAVAPLDLMTKTDDKRAFFAQNPGDYRVLDLVRRHSGADNGFRAGAPDLWGDDPLVSRRYSEFISWTQHLDPDQAQQNVAEFTALPPIYAMLRCRYVIRVDDGKLGVFEGAPHPMPQAQLISGYRLESGRDALFQAMAAPAFDPRRTVLLESEPAPRPVPSANPGMVRVANPSPDEIVVDAEVASPALLLITDPYSRDWRAVALAGSSQRHYDLLPANYILRAVPLAAGHHHLAIEYAPPSFRLGAGCSLGALALWLGAAAKSRRRSQG
jgi:hypothetical protein